MQSFKEFHEENTPTFEYIGDMEGAGMKLELFNNLKPFDKYDHAGFTLTRKTLETLGVKIPDNLVVGMKF